MESVAGQQPVDVPEPIFDALPRFEQLRIMRRVDRRHGQAEIVWGWRNIAEVACVDVKTARKAANGELWPDDDCRPLLRVHERTVKARLGAPRFYSHLSDILSFRQCYFGLPNILSTIFSREQSRALAAYTVK